MDAQANNYYDQSEEDVIGSEMRKGPWTVEEDSLLTQYVSVHGEGRWNSAARCAGLKRTGKSCRLRWLNYLRPEVRRGNITLQEQLLILELHSRWGNRWSKIAQRLPGRTDNEIKNYWRTRVQKQAKQLKCDVNSKQFRDAMRHVWIPRLIERIQAASSESSSSMGQPAATIPTTTTTTTTTTTAYQSSCYMGTNQMDVLTSQPGHSNEYGSEWSDPNFLPELSDSLDTQVSPASDLTTTATADGPNPYPSGYYPDCGQNASSGVYSGSDSGSWGWYNPGQEWNESLGMDSLEQMWNDESLLFLRQQLL